MAPPEGKHKVPGHGKGHGHKKDPEKGEKHDQAKLKLEEEHKVKIKPGDKDELGHVTQRLATILRGLTDGDGSALNQLAESLRGHDADVDLNVETDWRRQHNQGSAHSDQEKFQRWTDRQH